MNFWDSAKGLADLKLVSADIAGLLQAISDEGICISAVRSIDELTVECRIKRQDFFRIKEICEKRGAIVHLVSKKGLYWNVKSAIGRPILAVGLVLLAAFSISLPTRILFVEVTGNKTISAKEIKNAAESCGIRFGASRKAVRSERVKNQLLSSIADLQWAGVNTIGCTAVISVRERTNSTDEQQEGAVCSIIAKRDGIVSECTVTSGNSLCTVGQAVSAGQVLISGFTDCGICVKATRAEGEVVGDTAHELELILPDSFINRKGEEKTIKTFSLIVGKKRINLWISSGIWDTRCGRMYKEYAMTLPGGFQLPIAVAANEYTVYNCYSAIVDEDMARRELTDTASLLLNNEMISGTIRQKEETVFHDDGCYRLRGRYNCSELIGCVRWEQIGDYNGETG